MSPKDDIPEHKHSLSPDTTPLTPIKSPTDESSSFPLAAQIPVQSFTLPTFPPEASHLRELTLTSDIPLPDYQPLVTTGAEYELPNLPQSITHLTLELFSLGFPGRNPHFLTNLAKTLPNLKSITFFSCLIDGLTNHAREDAEAFFSPDLTPKLREIHVIDSFVRPGFWSAITKPWGKRAAEAASTGESDVGLKVVEVSYTYRGHEDFDFLARLHGEELALLIQPSSGIVGAGFGLVEVRAEEIPDVASPEAGVEDTEGNKMIDSKKKEVASGILPFANDSRATKALLKHFRGLKSSDLKDLKVLNLSVWTLTVDDLKEILDKIAPSSSSPSPKQEDGPGLLDLTISLLLTESWISSFINLTSHPALSSLAGLEIVGVPGKPIVEGEDWQGGMRLLDQSQKDSVVKLGEACPRLARLEMSILKAKRAGAVLWTREETGEWASKKL